MISQLYNKRVLFIDLETTGIPKIGKQVEGVTKMPGGYADYTKNQFYDCSRIVQIGWAYYDKFTDDFDVDEDSIDVVVRKPFNFIITDESYKIHGVSHEYASENGTLIKKILKGDLGTHLKQCDFIVAYNAYFDFSILMNELHRAKNEELYKKLYAMRNDNVVCLKHIGLLYTKKIHTQGKLYKILYGEDAQNQHDAKGDVYTMLKILQYIIKNPDTNNEHSLVHDENESSKLINHTNAGAYWSKDEDKKLQTFFLDDEKKVSEIAKIHGRTEGAIIARLKKLGLIINDTESSLVNQNNSQNDDADSMSDSLLDNRSQVRPDDGDSVEPTVNNKSNIDKKINKSHAKNDNKASQKVMIKYDKDQDLILLKKRVDDLERELITMKEMYQTVIKSLNIN